MKTLNWNQLAELGLLERINREVLHPLGLAACRDPESGVSKCALISDDGEWEYAPDIESKIINDDEVRRRYQDMIKSGSALDLSDV